MNFSPFSLNSDGEPIKLPDNLESLPRADHFPTQRHRWNTNEVSGKPKQLFSRNFDIVADEGEKDHDCGLQKKKKIVSIISAGHLSWASRPKREQRKWYETVMDSRSEFFLLANQLA